MLATGVGDEGDVGPGASCFHSRDLRLFMATALKGPGPHQVAGCEGKSRSCRSPGARGARPTCHLGPRGLAQPRSLRQPIGPVAWLGWGRF